VSAALQGNASQITTPLTATVTGTSSGAGGVIVISTSPTPHLFGNNDANVVLAGVGGTVEADGTWKITVISSTSFSLNGSTWVNAWTSGGMATDYALTPAMQVPTGGDPFTANTILPVLQMLADRDAALQNEVLNLTGLKAQTFTTSGTCTVPSGVTLATIFMVGGGGGGGGGQSGTSVNSEASCGGGGGGGAQPVVQSLVVTPGGTLNVTVGGGGAAGVGGSGPTSGGTGGASEVEDATTTSSVYAYGGSGGATSTTFADSGNGDVYAPGGVTYPNTLSNVPVYVSFATTTAIPVVLQQAPMTAGSGGTSYASISGSPYYTSSFNGFPNAYALGGTGASPGSTTGAKYGGGGGGGGGAGFARGGAGGTGGNGVASGIGQAGFAGTAAAANSGAGGGGGGGGGGGSTSGSAGANGGAGGSGLVVIQWG
jgi:hypothetical protein